MQFVIVILFFLYSQAFQETIFKEIMRSNVDAIPFYWINEV